MPYKPSTPTGDSVSGMEQALHDHPGGGVHAPAPMTPDDYNASQGLPKSSRMRTPVTEVQRGIAAGRGGNDAPKVQPESDWTKARKQAQGAVDFGSQVKQGLDLLGGRR